MTKLSQPNCVGFTKLHGWDKVTDKGSTEVFQCSKCRKVLYLAKSSKGELGLGQKKEHYKLFRRDYLQPSSWQFHAEYYENTQQ